MKKILAIFFVTMCMLAPWAQAFTVLDEVQVVPQPQNKTQKKTQVAANRNAAPAQKFKVTDEVQVPPPAISVVDDKRFNKKLNELLAASRKRIEATIQQKNEEASKAFSVLGNKVSSQEKAIGNLAEKIDGLQNMNADAKNNGVKLDTLSTRLFDEKKGALKEMRDFLNKESWLVGLELSKDFHLWLVIASLLVAAVVVVCFFFLRGTIGGLRKEMTAVGRKVEAVGLKIDDVPAQTAAKIKAIDPMVIELDDVAGHHVTYTPPIEDDMYVTLYVPSTVTKPVTDPTKIIRTRTADKGAIRRSTRKVMAAYFAATAKGAPTSATEQSKQQIALVNHLKDKQVSWS